MALISGSNYIDIVAAGRDMKLDAVNALLSQPDLILNTEWNMNRIFPDSHSFDRLLVAIMGHPNFNIPDFTQKNCDELVKLLYQASPYPAYGEILSRSTLERACRLVAPNLPRSWYFLKSVVRANIIIRSPVIDWRLRRPGVFTGTDTDLLLTIIESNGKVNPVDFGGCTVLHQACTAQELGLVQLLISLGVDVNARDFCGDTPLHHLGSVSRGGGFNGQAVCFNTPIAAALIEAGADVDITNDKGETPLFVAATRKQYSVMGTLIEAGADFSVRLTTGESILHHIVKVHYMDKTDFVAMEVLIRKGANIHAKDNNGNTALHYACRRHLSQPIALLIRLGAKIKVLNDKGQTPISLTRLSTASQITKALAARAYFAKAPCLTQDQLALFSACKSGDVDAVKALIDTGVGLNAMDETDLTAIDIAFEMKEFNIVMMLVNAGAEVNYSPTNVDGLSIFSKVVSSKNPALVKAFIDAGVDVNVSTYLEKTPLHIACSEGHVDVAMMLIEAGADVTVLDVNGDTPLHALCQSLSRMATGPLVSKLIERGVDVNALNKHGKTAIAGSQRLHEPDIVKLLLDAGAYFDFVDAHGRTLLHYLFRAQCYNSALVAMSCGVNIATPSIDGLTVLHAAIEDDKVETVEVILRSFGVD